MTVVALDTNALMMPVELDVRVFDELERLFGAVEPVIPRAVLDELERLAEGGGRAGTAARVGLDLARERCRVLELAGSAPPPAGGELAAADAAVAALAADGRAAAVVTNDQPLRDRLLAEGIPVVSVRGRNRLAVTRP